MPKYVDLTQQHKHRSSLSEVTNRHSYRSGYEGSRLHNEDAFDYSRSHPGGMDVAVTTSTARKAAAVPWTPYTPKHPNLLMDNQYNTTVGGMDEEDDDEEEDDTLEESSMSHSSAGVTCGNKQIKRWEERFDELVKFKVLYGSCRVPHRYAENPGLARWVVYMRSAYQAGTLTEDRVNKLNSMGFVWSDRGHTTWDKRLQQMKEYTVLHGTSRVSCDCLESQQLWRWSSVQRSNYRLGKLSEERIQALDELGFVWDVDQDDWDRKYQELEVFYKVNKHTRIPNKEPYKKLFLWTRVQRTKFHDKILVQDRIRKLELVSFCFEKNSMYTSSTGHVTMNGSGEVSTIPLAVAPTVEVANSSPSEPMLQSQPPYHHYSCDRQMNDYRARPTPLAILPRPHHYNHHHYYHSTEKVSGNENSVSINRYERSSLPNSMTTTTSAAANTAKVVTVHRSPACSKKTTAAEQGGFDRLLQLAELARQFSPVPESPVPLLSKRH